MFPSTPAIQERSGACSMRVHLDPNHLVANTWTRVNIRSPMFAPSCPQLESVGFTADEAAARAVIKRLAIRLVTGAGAAIADNIPNNEIGPDTNYHQYTSVDESAPVDFQEYDSRLGMYRFWVRPNGDGVRLELKVEFDVIVPVTGEL